MSVPEEEEGYISTRWWPAVQCGVLVSRVYSRASVKIIAVVDEVNCLNDVAVGKDASNKLLENMLPILAGHNSAVD